MTANAFFPTLFSPIDIGGVTLGNRIIHAAIVTQYVADGAPTKKLLNYCLLYTSPSPRDLSTSRMPSSA